ncbi:ferrous iron transporter B, partial [bacterium]|nr:ferrous iron transporter B [bacterium]
MRKESKEILVAVAGQPNSGKSTIFNLLTGARQHVANYPGITVEKKTGTYYYKGNKIILVDLPGNYSLTSYTLEERIARDFVLHEKPDVVVDIIDASNLERNLYLAFQLSEMGLPLVLDLNMMDVAKRRGFEIDLEELSRQMGALVVSTVGSRGRGKKELRQTIYQAYQNRERLTPIRLDYGKTLEPILSRLERELSKDPRLTERYLSRWLAVKLLENDSEAQKIVKRHSQNPDTLLSTITRERKKFISQYRTTPEKLIAQKRYQSAEEIIGRCVKRAKEIRRTLTDRIDQVLCNRFAG